MTNNNKNRIFGIAVSIVFHLIAMILLLTLCFRTPLPLPGEAGVEVNLGMYAAAMNQQASTTTNIQEEKIVKQAEVVEENEDIISADEEAPSIEEKKEEIEEKTEEPDDIEEVVEEVVEEKPVVNQRAIFQVRKNDNSMTSEGDKEGEGEQGKPDGLKDIDRYDGQGGSGGGPSYDLGGRGAKSIPSPSRNFKEEGKVVIDIWVDKNGIVKRAEFGKGTTVTDSSMKESARQAALNSVFVEDKDAADLQRGTITYTFIIRQ